METCLVTIRRWNRDFLEIQVDDAESLFEFKISPGHATEFYKKLGEPLVSMGLLPISVSDLPLTPTGVFTSGWLCPACGRGNAPTTATCPCKPWPKQEVTS